MNTDSSAEARSTSATTVIDEALADYEQALVINPQYPSALYGRGIIRTRKGDLAGGGADIAAATRYRATIAAEMGRAGVK